MKEAKYRINEHVRYYGRLAIVRLTNFEDNDWKYQIGVFTNQGSVKFDIILWVKEDQITQN